MDAKGRRDRVLCRREAIFPGTSAFSSCSAKGYLDAPLFPARLPHLCARAVGSGGADVGRLGKVGTLCWMPSWCPETPVCPEELGPELQSKHSGEPRP